MDKRFTMAVVFLTFAKVNTTMETGQGNKSSPFPFPYPKSNGLLASFLVMLLVVCRFIGDVLDN